MRERKTISTTFTEKLSPSKDPDIPSVGGGDPVMVPNSVTEIELRTLSKLYQIVFSPQRFDRLGCIGSGCFRVSESMVIVSGPSSDNW